MSASPKNNIDPDVPGGRKTEKKREMPLKGLNGEHPIRIHD